MLAAVAAAVLVTLGAWYPLAILGGIASALAISILSFYGLIVPLKRRGASLDAMVVALLGLTIVLRYGAGLSLGRAERALPAPASTATLSSYSEFRFSRPRSPSFL